MNIRGPGDISAPGAGTRSTNPEGQRMGIQGASFEPKLAGIWQIRPGIRIPHVILIDSASTPVKNRQASCSSSCKNKTQHEYSTRRCNLAATTVIVSVMPNVMLSICENSDTGAVFSKLVRKSTGLNRYFVEVFTAFSKSIRSVLDI